MESTKQDNISPEIDPKLLFERAPDILNALARLSSAVIESWSQYHTDPKVRLLAGDAVALIMSLRMCHNVPDSVTQPADSK